MKLLFFLFSENNFDTTLLQLDIIKSSIVLFRLFDKN